MTSTRILAAVLLTATLALAGCSLAPAPAPTPEAMSVQEAGEYYLDTVCPSNAVSEAIGAAYSAGDLPGFVAAAETARDAYKQSATRFGDASVVWPDEIAADIVTLRDTSIVIAAAYETLSEITTLDDAGAVTFPDSTSAAEASQRIREALDLSSDPLVSCG